MRNRKSADTSLYTVAKNNPSRRDMLKLPMLAAAALPLWSAPAKRSALKPLVFPSPQLTLEQQFFLGDLTKRSVLYFLEHASPITGMVRDRARNFAEDPNQPNRSPASIAATGFSLSALCIGAERGYLPAVEAQQRIRKTLDFFAKHAYQNHGWFYHFMDADTGDRKLRSEVSSIDSAILVAGALTARQYFPHDREITSLTDQIYQRLDFQWMLNGHRDLLSHGWRPGSGFIGHRWDSYSEHMILYLLGLGSPTYPLRAESWYAWQRPRVGYGEYSYVTGPGALFTHQYSHAWVDFRDRYEFDTGINWFTNSVAATRAHREFCLSLAPEHGYSEKLWGVTASDSARGYRDWGGQFSRSSLDGTVVPCAAGGSLMFAPDICIPALQAMHDGFSERVYQRYGFSDAFNPQTNWTDTDVLGIDLGITMMSAENLRTGNVWRWFMKNPEILSALDRARLLPA